MILFWNLVMLLETGGCHLVLSTYIWWFQANPMALRGGFVEDHLFVYVLLGDCNYNNATTDSIVWVSTFNSCQETSTRTAYFWLGRKKPLFQPETLHCLVLYIIVFVSVEKLYCLSRLIIESLSTKQLNFIVKFVYKFYVFKCFVFFPNFVIT